MSRFYGLLFFSCFLPFASPEEAQRSCQRSLRLALKGIFEEHESESAICVSDC